MVELTAAHWVYLAFVVAVLITMILRKDTPLVCIIGSFVLAWVVTGRPVVAVQTVFKSMTVAFQELLGIVAIISVIVGLAKMMEENGLAEMIFAPVRRSLRSPTAAFWILGVVIMFVALFLWPSPAIALVGAMLLPAAIEVGLPPISAAMAISMFGYGLALTTDVVIQGAPGITSKAAEVQIDSVMWASARLAVPFAAVALPLTFISTLKDIRAAKGKPIEWEPFQVSPEQKAEVEKWQARARGFKSFALWLIVISLLTNLVIMFVFELRGGSATALLGGTIILVMSVISAGVYGSQAFDKFTEHARSGFRFGVRIFTPVFFIAAFFFMGSPSQAAIIFGEGARGLLFDLGQALANAMPLGRVPTGLVEAIVGGITGLDGSGFSGLPMVGTMAQALGKPSGLDVAQLAALGQFFAVAIGGGCIVPWAVIPAAAISGTDPVELARRNFVPTMAGLLAVLIVAVFFL